jgi:hypothetical protein
MAEESIVLWMKARRSRRAVLGWHDSTGREPGHQRNDDLEQKGFRRGKEERGIVFRGLKLASTKDADAQPQPTGY